MCGATTVKAEVKNCMVRQRKPLYRDNGIKSTRKGNYFKYLCITHKGSQSQKENIINLKEETNFNTGIMT